MSPIKGHRPTVSVCTTCFNRFAQLKEVFDANLAELERCDFAEWVILNFSAEPDDLDAFMQERLPQLPNRVVYAKNRRPMPWHLSVAKNLAHRQGRGAMLFNLDCDNLLGDATTAVGTHHWSGAKLVHLWSGKFGDGTCGRVAVSRPLFYELGGYDESFHPMGFQDRDLIQRGMAAGIRCVFHACGPHLAIPNSKEESVKYCDLGGKTWTDFDRANQARSASNIAAGRLRANVAREWAPLDVDVRCGGRGSD
jgi:hypothetical protein